MGKGWSFPPTFSKGGRQVAMTGEAENVHKCIYLILHTGLGERVLKEDFGGSLQRYLFEPISRRLLIDIKDTVSTAILRYEPRVLLDRVDIGEDQNIQGRLLIQLQYTLRSSNTRFNMVYPFYVNEAEQAL